MLSFPLILSIFSVFSASKTRILHNASRKDFKLCAFVTFSFDSEHSSVFYVLQKSEFYIMHIIKVLNMRFWVFPGDEAVCRDDLGDHKSESCPRRFKKLLLFSGNDYLGLSSHPTIGKAAAKVWS